MSKKIFKWLQIIALDIIFINIAAFFGISNIFVSIIGILVVFIVDLLYKVE